MDEKLKERAREWMKHQTRRNKSMSDLLAAFASSIQEEARQDWELSLTDHEKKLLLRAEKAEQQLAEARAQGMREALLLMENSEWPCSCKRKLATAIERAAQTPPASQDGVAAKCPKCGGKLCQPYKSTETSLWTQRCDKCAYFDSWAGIEPEPRAGRDLEGK